jgi:hypothetical protein
MADSSADLANRLPRATLFRRAIARARWRRPAHQRRRQVGVDGQLDAFGAFVAVGQAADRRGLADALHAVAAAQAHDHQRLLLHRGHGQLVRPDRRQIDQDGLDGRNRRGHTFSMQIRSCNEYVP